MTMINTIAGLLVPSQGTLAGELFAARNAATPAAGAPAVAAQAVAAPAVAATPPEALARLASAQGGLAPLYADVAAVATRPDLPQEVRIAAQAMLTLGLDATAIDGKAIDGKPIDGKAIENAILKSGLFLEGAIAKGEAADGDLKLALLSLRNALHSALPEGVRAPALSSALPPPHRTALPVGEQPALPSILALDSDGASLKLLSETDAALARTTLLQLASLPDANPSNANNTTQRLVVDIPIATPQGHAVIQLQVEPDNHRHNAEGEERLPSWRINLALDIEPLGPVRASITQIAGRTHVNLFAEREASARVLRDDLPALQTQLSEAALEPGDLNCRSGTPQREPAAPGLFVDRAS
jgi:hypothetical protein